MSRLGEPLGLFACVSLWKGGDYAPWSGSGSDPDVGRELSGSVDRMGNRGICRFMRDFDLFLKGTCIYTQVTYTINESAIR